MTAGHGYDYSVPTHIPLDVVAGTGADLVARYLDGPHALSAAEAAEIRAQGLGVLPIFEHGATAADDPSLAESFARSADRLCDRLGVPVDVPVVHCDDFNDAIDSEPEFFRRAVLASRRPVMMYGSIALARVVADLGVKYFWIVGTWQGGPERRNGTLAFEPEGIHMVQLANTRNPVIPGVLTKFYDTNIILEPFPTWGRIAGDDVPAEDVYNYIFKDAPFGLTRFELAFLNAMHKFMTPEFGLDGHTPQTFLGWISFAAKAGVGSLDAAAIKAAIQEAIAALPAERGSSISTDDVADAVLKALAEQPLAPPNVRVP